MTAFYRFVKPGHPNYPKGIKDITHFSVRGAAMLAVSVTEELRRIKSPLTAFIKPELTAGSLEQQFRRKHNIKEKD
jgi:hypothetical protein